MELKEISLDDLEFAEDNVRTKPGDLIELAKSIAQNGLIQAIAVSPLGDGKYKIVAGERRTRAALLVRDQPDKYKGPYSGLTTLPALIEERSDTGRMVAMLIENLQRVDISPLEEAKGYAALVNEGAFSQNDIAARVGRSKAHVSKRLSLLGLTKKAQAKLEADEITIEVALELVKLAEHPEVMDSLLDGYNLGAWRIAGALKEIEAKQARQAALTDVAAVMPEGVTVTDAIDVAKQEAAAPENTTWAWLDETAFATWDKTVPEGTSVVEVSEQPEGLWLSFYGYLENEWVEKIPAAELKKAQKQAGMTAAQIKREEEYAAQRAEQLAKERIERAVALRKAEHDRAWLASVAKKPRADDLKALFRASVLAGIGEDTAKEVAQVLELMPVVKVTTDYTGKERTHKDWYKAVHDFANESAANTDRVCFVAAFLRQVRFDRVSELAATIRSTNGYPEFDEKRARAEAKAKQTTKAAPKAKPEADAPAE